jgi:hypothetical protein
LLIDLFVALSSAVVFPFFLVWSNMQDKKGVAPLRFPHVILFATPSSPPEEIKMFRGTCVCVCVSLVSQEATNVFVNSLRDIELIDPIRAAGRAEGFSHLFIIGKERERDLSGFWSFACC